MTQRQISHPEGLPTCSAGHSARHIHDQRCASAGGGHFIECRCKSTIKKNDPDSAIAEWRKLNRPTRRARSSSIPVAVADNVLQFNLALAEQPAAQLARSISNTHGGRQ